MITRDSITKIVQETTEEMQTEKELIEECYGSETFYQCILSYLFSYQPNELTNNYESILFHETPSFFTRNIGIPEQKHDIIHRQYDFIDPVQRISTVPPKTIDVLVQRLSKHPLSEEGVVIDVEFLERPHISSPYFTLIKQRVKEAKELFSENQKEFARFLHKNNQNIVCDTEKLHVTFLLNNNTCIPIYVGIGTNQHVGLSIDGESKERYFKQFIRGKSFVSRQGVLRKHKILRKPTFVYEEYSGSQKYFFDPQNKRFLTENFEELSVDFTEEEIPFKTYLSNPQNYNGLKIVSELLNEKLPSYEYFSDIAYNPYMLLKLTSLPRARACIRKSFVDKTGLEEESNIAGSLSELQDSERLKATGLLFTYLYKTNSLQELMNSVSSKQT